MLHRFRLIAALALLDVLAPLASETYQAAVPVRIAHIGSLRERVHPFLLDSSLNSSLNTPGPQQTQEPSIQGLLTGIQNQNLQKNHFLFADSTDGWTASPGLYDYAFAADTAITMLNYPAYFTPAQVLNTARKFIAARNTAGEFPIALQKSGAAFVFYSAWDLLHHHATGDGAFYVPQLEYLYYKESKTTAAFSKDAEALKTALSKVRRDETTGMVEVRSEDQWVPWGFQDMVRKTGDDLMGSLLYYKAASDMAAMYKATEHPAEASFFNAQTRRIRTNVTGLWDARGGMFYAATGANRQIDIEGSAYAVFLGVASASQSTAISKYLAKNYMRLTETGYVRQSPKDWGSCYSIHGGPCSFKRGQYDNGAWPVANGWSAFTLAKTNTALAVRLVDEFAHSTDPTQEYWAWHSKAAPYSGQTLNLESPSGALSYVLTNPALFAVPTRRLKHGT